MDERLGDLPRNERLLEFFRGFLEQSPFARTDPVLRPAGFESVVSQVPRGEAPGATIGSERIGFP